MSRNDVPPESTAHVVTATSETTTASAAATATVTAPTPIATATATEAQAQAADRFAAWLLRGPLIVLLAGLGLVQLATWIPHYLTWPYWADHDVFATIAQEWARGLRPYRDLPCNNFPGTIYLFWFLGKAFGWGNPISIYALDATLLLSLGAMMLTWSRRRLGGILPGLVGYLTFVSYYLGLDYAHAAQRDWHAPFFAMMSLLIAQTWSNRFTSLVSGLAMACAVSIRPQTVLFLPALALAVDESTRRSGEALGKTVKQLIFCAIGFAVGVVAAFAPLVLEGVIPDFIQGVRLASYGNAYNRVTLGSFLLGWFLLLSPLRTSLVPVAIALLALRSETATRRLALVWVAAVGLGSLYKPLSPFAHSYLDIPLMLVWSISLAVLVHLVLAMLRQAPSLQLVATLMILALGVTVRPYFCAVGPTVRAIAAFRQGKLPDEVPPGYRKGTVGSSGVYPWRDYHALIEYLKRETTPDTLLANVLKADPSITAATARRSAFPAESIAWLRILRPDQQDDYAEILSRSKNTVVVWIPDEVGPEPEFKVDQLAAVIRKHFQPDVQFGSLEVWRRKGESRTQAKGKPQSAASSLTPAAGRSEGEGEREAVDVRS